MNKSKLREHSEDKLGMVKERFWERIDFTDPADLFSNVQVVSYEDIEWLLIEARKAILEEVRSKIIGNDENPSVYAGVNENRGVYKINDRNELRKEQRHKLSILEGEK